MEPACKHCGCILVHAAGCSSDIDLVQALIKHRHTTATPRGRDVKKLPKPYTCREVVFTCSNGYTIEKLSRADYALEGFFMGHCLGGKHSTGSHAAYSLREPDGTPHVTLIGAVFGLHGRCNAYPREKYVRLINEWANSIGQHPMPLTPKFQEAFGWGVDHDTEYHDKGILTDSDYRDLHKGRHWRDEEWQQKRKKN